MIVLTPQLEQSLRDAMLLDKIGEYKVVPQRIYNAMDLKLPLLPEKIIYKENTDIISQLRKRRKYTNGHR
jgi:hypothetical protein